MPTGSQYCLVRSGFDMHAYRVGDKRVLSRATQRVHSTALHKLLLHQPGRRARPAAAAQCQAVRRHAYRLTVLSCHIARQPGALDKLVKLEQLTGAQHDQYAQDLQIPYNKDDFKVSLTALIPTVIF